MVTVLLQFVAGEDGGGGDGDVTGPVGVVHHGVETLVEPLPEDNLRHSFVKLKMVKCKRKSF